MFEKFTQRARSVVMAAQEQAGLLHSPVIGTEHLLLGLLTEERGIGARVLAGLGVDQRRVLAQLEPADAEALRVLGIDLAAVRARVEAAFGPGALDRPVRRRRGLLRRAAPGHIPFTPGAKKVLERSLREALLIGDSYIGTEHILLGLVSDESETAVRILRGLGVTLDLAAFRDLVRARIPRVA